MTTYHQGFGPIPFPCLFHPVGQQVQAGFPALQDFKVFIRSGVIQHLCDTTRVIQKFDEGGASGAKSSAVDGVGRVALDVNDVAPLGEGPKSAARCAFPADRLNTSLVTFAGSCTGFEGIKSQHTHISCGWEELHNPNGFIVCQVENFAGDAAHGELLHAGRTTAADDDGTGFEGLDFGHEPVRPAGLFFDDDCME